MDHRSTLRQPIDVAASLTIDGLAITCSVRNISIGGVFVIGPSLPIDRRATLRFTLPRHPEIEVVVIARWATPDGTGFQFDGLRAADTYAVGRYIRSKARATARTAAADILAARLPGESSR